MRLKIKTLFSKKNIKKLLRSALCILLSVLTIVCFGGVLVPTEAHAVTGVEEIITFVIAIMIACGVSFTSTSVAQSTAERFYNSADSETKSIIDKAYELYESKKEYYTTTTNGFFMCLASEWQIIFEAITSFIFTRSVIADSSFVDFSVPQATFKNYDSFSSLLEQNGSLDFDYQCTKDSYSSFVIGSTMIELIGKDILADSSVPQVVIDRSKKQAYPDFYRCNIIMKVSLLGSPLAFYAPFCGSIPYTVDNTTYYNTKFSFFLDEDGVINFKAFHRDSLIASVISLISLSIHHGGKYNFLYYGDEQLTLSYTDNFSTEYSLTSSTFGNIVCDDGTILGTDYLIPCDSDKITDDILTKVFTCDPAIGIGNEYIGTDQTWSDSIADAGSGSIAFPLDLDDLIDSSASDVRDKTLTDTGDIATDKTDDKTDTNTDTDKDSKPKPPSIPQMSLPEILFKEKFPFCLPWDIYNLFVRLQAEEEAPRFVVPFKFERLGIDEEIVIDFSQYEDQIAIIRFFTGAMFVLALIMVSRRLVGAE